MNIFYAPEVADELADARDWYDCRAAGLGEEFLRMAYVVFEELVEFPKKTRKGLRVSSPRFAQALPLQCLLCCRPS